MLTHTLTTIDFAARFSNRLRKNSVSGGFWEGHDFTGCGKTLIHAGFWEGHEFTRAVSR